MYCRSRRRYSGTILRKTFKERVVNIREEWIELDSTFLQITDTDSAMSFSRVWVISLTVFLLSIPIASSLSVPYTTVQQHNYSSDSVETRDSGTVNAVLQSASNHLVVPIPLDGLPYKISALIGPSSLPNKAVDGLQYDSIRLLDDERCIFETATSILVVGGGVATSLSVAPPQSILSIACAPDLA